MWLERKQKHIYILNLIFYANAWAILESPGIAFSSGTSLRDATSQPAACAMHAPTNQYKGIEEKLSCWVYALERKLPCRPRSDTARWWSFKLTNNRTRRSWPGAPCRDPSGQRHFAVAFGVNPSPGRRLVWSRVPTADRPSYRFQEKTILFAYYWKVKYLLSIVAAQWALSDTGGTMTRSEKGQTLEWIPIILYIFYHLSPIF